MAPFVIYKNLNHCVGDTPQKDNAFYYLGLRAKLQFLLPGTGNSHKCITDTTFPNVLFLGSIKDVVMLHVVQLDLERFFILKPCQSPKKLPLRGFLGFRGDGATCEQMSKLNPALL